MGLGLWLMAFLQLQAASALRPSIVGGQDAAPGEFPWIGSLQGPWDCGATLIGSQWVLTAAHCVTDDAGRLIPAEDFKLSIGGLYLSDITEYHAIEQIIVHPGFQASTMVNDIALLRLAQPLDAEAPTLSWNSDPEFPLPGTDAVVAGWGTLSADGSTPDRLQKVVVPVVSTAKANETKAYAGSVQPSMLAAGYVDGGKDSCQGDSGGPLVIEVHGHWLQVGIVSWGKGCAEPYAYGIYTRLSSFADWIEGITGLPGDGSQAEPIPLEILKQPQSVSALPGQPAVLTVTASGQEPMAYQWFLNGVALASAQTASMTVPEASLADVGSYTVMVSGGGQELLSDSAELTLSQIIDLAEALDQPTWLFEVDQEGSSWLGQANESHDQMDAVHSVALGNNEMAVLSTELEGPGHLGFFWKVSSETSWDNLKFLVDGQVLASISGERHWEAFTTTLTGGKHRIQWIYQKDHWLSQGQDRGWVDQVYFLPIDALQIIQSPTSRDVLHGQPASFQVEAAGTPPLSYQWYFNDELIPGAQSNTLDIADASFDQAGAYQVAVISGSDQVMSEVATLKVMESGLLGQALEQPLLPFVTGDGAEAWFHQTAMTHDQVDAAQSGAVESNQASVLSTSLQGPGILKFFWKVSSEPIYDRLECWLDEKLESRISGEVDWREAWVAIPEGFHTVRWVYSKDNLLVQGSDAAWLDQISYQPSISLVITQEPESILTAIGQMVHFLVEAVGDAILNYQWFLDGVAIEGATKPIFQIDSVSLLDEGEYTVAISAGGEAEFSQGAALSLLKNPTLADALDQPDWDFTASGDHAWEPQSAISHDGIDAAQTPFMADNQAATVRVSVEGPGWLRFNWRVSSERGWDVLECWSDQELHYQISGEVDWTPVAIPIPEGSHQVSWVYRKDHYVSEGQDRAWLDAITFEPQVIEQISLYREAFESKLQALPWMVTQVENAATDAYQEEPGDTFWVSQSPNETGLVLQMSSSSLLLAPSSAHPFHQVLTGNYLERHYKSFSWDLHLKTSSAPLGMTSLNLYREEGDSSQIASLPMRVVVDQGGEYRFTAHFDDPAWVLENPDHPWGLSEVMENVTGLSIGFAAEWDQGPMVDLQVSGVELLAQADVMPDWKPFLGVQLEDEARANQIWITHWPDLALDFSQQWSGDLVFSNEAGQQPGLRFSMLGNALYLTPHDGLPLAGLLQGDLRSKGIESLVWDVSLDGDLAGVASIGALLYRSDGQDEQIAMFDLPVPDKAGVNFQIEAPLIESGWELLNENGVWNFEEVLSHVDKVGLVVNSASQANDLAWINLHAFGGLMSWPTQASSDDASSDGMQVRGRVLLGWSSSPQPMQGAQVSLYQAGQVWQQTTDAEGQYVFDLTSNTAISLKADCRDYQERASQGVDVGDVVRMRRHILVKDPFQSTHEMVAADANRDGSVDVADVLSMRRVILSKLNYFSKDAYGYPESFWRLTRADFLQTPAHQALSGLASAEEIFHDALEGDLDNVDFAAIRLGDVNGDWIDTRYPDPSVDQKAARSPQLWLGKPERQPNGLVAIALEASRLESLVGLQFELRWDPDVLELVSFDGSVLRGFNPTSHASQEPGSLVLAWDDAQLLGQPVAANEALLQLSFNISPQAEHGTSLSLHEPLWVAEDGSVRRSIGSKAFFHPDGLPVLSQESLIRFCRMQGTTLMLECETVPDKWHVIESCPSLKDASWQPVGLLEGNGMIQVFEVPALSLGQRFYRLR